MTEWEKQGVAALYGVFSAMPAARRMSDITAMAERMDQFRDVSMQLIESLIDGDRDTVEEKRAELLELLEA